MNPNSRLIELMREHIGLREEGENRGELIDKFNLASGVPVGSPWCLSLIQYLVAQVDYELGLKNKLPKTASVMYLWGNCANKLLCGPEPGTLVIWQMYSKSGFPTSAGHVGVISHRVSSEVIQSIEGNTRGVDPASGIIDRDGKEVVEQRRVLNKNGRPMAYLGCLNPWMGKGGK
jgi:hypothetical protein